MKASAFAPAHISGFFSPVIDKNDFKKSGSSGAGINITLGAISEVNLKKSDEQIFEIYINRKKIFSPVIKDVLKYLAGDLRAHITVNTKLDLPMGQGFGMSGASALSTGLALSKILGISREEALKSSHFAEVKNQTGLGDVMASFFGGVEIRKRPGLPPWGFIERINGNFELVLCIVGESLDTRDILSDKNKLDTIINLGNHYTKKLIKRPTIENLFLYSEEFTRKTDLANENVLDAIDKAKKYGYASMCMLGNSVFAMGKTKEIKRILSFCGDIYICGVNKNGAKIMQ